MIPGRAFQAQRASHRAGVSWNLHFAFVQIKLLFRRRPELLHLQNVQRSFKSLSVTSEGNRRFESFLYRRKIELHARVRSDRKRWGEREMRMNAQIALAQFL